MNTYRREFVLSSGSIVASLSGCLNSPSSGESDQPTETTMRTRQTESEKTTSSTTASTLEPPQDSECEKYSAPSPNSTEAGLEPKQYPSFPDTVTQDTAQEFVAAYERAIQWNLFLRDGATGYDSAFVQGGYDDVNSRGNGFVVEATGELKMTDTSTSGTETRRPTGDVPYRTWYYVSNQFALRAATNDTFGGTGPEDPPSFSDADPVACDGAINNS